MADFDIMNLQVEEPKCDIDDYTWTIYGEAGIGKSSMCAFLYPDPAFFQWEQGQNVLRAKKIPVADWKGFKKLVKDLQKGYAEGKPMPMKSAIMDTVDFAWKKCVEYVCKNNGWSHPSDGEWGKGWDAVATEWEMEMANLEYIGIKPIFISHDKDKEFKPKKGEKYNQVLPAVPTGCIATIVDKVDMVMYCTYEKVEQEDGTFEKVRRMYFRSNGDFKCKSRLTYMPDYLDFGATPAETAQIIKDAFAVAVEKEFGNGAEVSPTPAPKKEPKKEPKKDKTERAEKVEKVDKKDNPPADTDTKPKDNTPVAGDDGDTASLDAMKAEIEKILKADLKNKKRTPVEIVSLVQEHTGLKKIADLKDIDKAKALLNAIK